MWHPLVSYYKTVLCCDYFSSLNVVSCAFSALRIYSKLGHHPHPLRYLCAKFCFCCDLHCWASPWRKILYSITQPPSLFDAPGTEACAALELRLVSFAYTSSFCNCCVGFSLSLPCNLVAVRLGLLVPAKPLVGRLGFCTSQMTGWDGKIVSEMTYNMSSETQNITIMTKYLSPKPSETH